MLTDTSVKAEIEAAFAIKKANKRWEKKCSNKSKQNKMQVVNRFGDKTKLKRLRQ